MSQEGLTFHRSRIAQIACLLLWGSGLTLMMLGLIRHTHSISISNIGKIALLFAAALYTLDGAFVQIKITSADLIWQNPIFKSRSKIIPLHRIEGITRQFWFFSFLYIIEGTTLNGKHVTLYSSFFTKERKIFQYLREKIGNEKFDWS